MKGARIILLTAILIFPFLIYGESTRPNILFLSIDDLRPELNCYGIDYIHSPHIDKLASEGILFDRHYVQAPTCGASRYALLTGKYGSPGNSALFDRAAQLEDGKALVDPSLPAWLRMHDYETVSIGKVSHHPGGLGGTEWNDPNEVEMPQSWDRILMPVGAWQHPKGAMHGLANGEIRRDASTMDVYQSHDGPDESYPDGLIAETADEELQRLAEKGKPFFLAVGFIRPHLPFGAPKRFMEYYQDLVLPPILYPDRPEGRSTWHRSSEFMRYNRWDRDPNEDAEFADLVRKHYAACVSYIDTQVGKVIQRLDSLGLSENTIIILWGDHGWHLGEHGIWGKHSLFEESLRSPLIISYPTKIKPKTRSDSIVETVDIFPTITHLANIPTPDFLNGQLLPLESNPEFGEDGEAVSYHRNYITIRNNRYRLIVHKDGYTELYDHDSAARETLNIAESHPDVVARMIARLRQLAPDKMSVYSIN